MVSGGTALDCFCAFPTDIGKVHVEIFSQGKRHNQFVWQCNIADCLPRIISCKQLGMVFADPTFVQWMDHKATLSNVSLQVRHLLHSQDMVSNLAAHGYKPDDVLGSLLGPWGASSPQTDLKRHEMEKLLTAASADSHEIRSAKQELEKLLDAQLPDDESAKAESDAGSSDSKTDAADDT